MDAALLGLVPQRPACTVLTPSGGVLTDAELPPKGKALGLAKRRAEGGMLQTGARPREATRERLLPARTPKSEPSTSPSLNWPSPPVALLLRQFYWLIPPGKGRITIITPAGLRRCFAGPCDPAYFRAKPFTCHPNVPCFVCSTCSFPPKTGKAGGPSLPSSCHGVFFG